MLAAVITGCGGSKEAAPPPVPGKTVRGTTETGMRLTVQTFFEPAKDARLKRLDEWRAARGYRDVDFHRVTADNTGGPEPDSGRTIRFAPSAAQLAAGAGVEARFTCDALQFEWLPTDAGQNEDWRTLRRDVCADGPPKPQGIAAGETQVYYLVTDRGFAERGLRRLPVFGPRDAQLK